MLEWLECGILHIYSPGPFYIVALASVCMTLCCLHSTGIIVYRHSIVLNDFTMGKAVNYSVSLTAYSLAAHVICCMQVSFYYLAITTVEFMQLIQQLE